MQTNGSVVGSTLAVGLTRVDTVSKYDSEGLGLSGRLNSVMGHCCTAPGSKELSMEMLNACIGPAALQVAVKGRTVKESSHPKMKV